jgi:molybdate transport system permease protein
VTVNSPHDDGSSSLAQQTGSLRHRSEFPFYAAMIGLSGSYVLLIVLLMLSDAVYTSPGHLLAALQRPEIQYAILLTLKTCTVSAILALWLGVPLAWLLSRHRFWGRSIIDTIVDIPLVLPPLVLGLSLLILFHTSIAGWELERWLRTNLHFPVTYHVPSVILAQVTVATAFAVRTMRVAFAQINPRAEDVARTLGCTRAQAFLQVCLPQAVPGMLAAFTIAWARALGEFGPILVFAGTTRMRTEVLSTTVFLELGVGRLEAAVAVSLLMVSLAIVVLLVLRCLGGWTEK